MKNVDNVLRSALKADRSVKIHVVSSPNSVWNFVEKNKNRIDVINDGNGFVTISNKIFKGE